MEFLKSPVGGTPDVIATDVAFAKAVTELKSGHGPIAVDAERASGFRYSSRAYLIQIYRRDGGLHLIDPIPLRNAHAISELNALFSTTEVIIHASTQDLPCLRDFGLHPQILFDTELGARLAGVERVGLAPLCEKFLEISLAKEHSAVDWSIRPLLPEWLDYAALDVAVLIDLRDQIERLLTESSKLELAREEFASVIAAPPPQPRKDPWRRTSGMHLIKSRFELAIVRALWIVRDQIAAELDIAPGRLFSDSIITEIAKRKPKSRAEFLTLPAISQRIKKEILRSRIDFWWEQTEKAYLLPEIEWPELRARGEGLPPPRIWKSKFPIAHLHLLNARYLLTQISHEREIPLENLVTPEFVRKIAFDQSRERINQFDDSLVLRINQELSEFGARKWQRDLVSEAIARALCESEAPPEPEVESRAEVEGPSEE